MSAFAPETYAEALEIAQNRPRKIRTPLRSGNGFRTRPAEASARKTARKKKSVRAKLPTRKKLVQTLDALTSQIVRLRDGQCVLCHSTERLQCGHLFGRRSHGARWDIERDGNCHTQCAGCNQRHNYDPWRYFNWYLDWHGRQAFDALYHRWEAGHKYSRLELITLVDEYKARLEEMQQQNGEQP